MEPILRHVDLILSRTSTRALLEGVRAELEEEMEERRVATLAKAILQATAGLLEEDAHAHLRTISRRSRMKLKEAALEVIEKT